ncbi:hypothetical protein GFY24_21045 [Nocardia sp. SYP-A9097]|uniref:hypothetical protein n=1 Tax=Nocardia sp. SYP-A9097 TaxID=2663237 RepID=UPI00129C0AFA|nr:hypothetical protein [Nocardia sp. SYP-A9097]MRH89898.1 hypothetical protein [Nocardia sp. SYP-A9097]
MKGILPALGGFALLFAAAWTAVTSWFSAIFVLGVGSLLIGIPIYLVPARLMPPFFRGEVLARQLPEPTERIIEADAPEHEAGAATRG